MRPNFMAVGAYDGMHLMYEALKKTGGKTDGDLLAGRDQGHGLGKPARADLDRSGTRDIVQNVYIRKVAKKNGELFNVEFATFPSVKDPIKAAAK